MANLANNKHNIKVEILTPLSIGGSSENNWKVNVDYIINKGKLYHFCLEKMLEYGIKSDAIACAYANQKQLSNLVATNDLEKICNKVLPCPISEASDVKNMITNQLSGNPIIPGSSLKGAIRSAILHNMLIDQKPYNMKEADYFGKLKDGEDFMRYIKVGDIEFFNTELVNTKIYNLRNVGKEEWDGGWKHESKRGTNDSYDPIGFNTLYECLTPNMASFGSISISSISNGDYFKHGINTTLKKEILEQNGIQKLFKYINQSTKDYLIAEREFFNTYSDADGSKEILDNIDNLLNSIPKNNSYCILKMAAGTGFHSITGNWQYSDFVNIGTWNESNNPRKPQTWGKHKYKSRKIADYKDNLTLMGFVKISLV